MLSELLRYLIWKRRHPTLWAGNYVDVNGIRLYYETYGLNNPGLPLVLLHGGSAFLESFFCQILPFSQQYKVIAVDSRGHGRSTDADEPLDYASMASDVLGLLDSLQFNQVNLLGWSDGAIMGIDIAINHPERLHKLILSGANFHYAGQKASWQKKYRKATGDHWIGFGDRWVYRRLAPDPSRFNILIEKIKTMWDTQPVYTVEQLSSIVVPTLILNGKKEECIPREHTAELAGAVPGAQLMELEGAGHELFLQKPKKVNQIVKEFLNDN